MISNTPMFSFVAQGATPLAADRYHRVFNFGLHHMALLYGYQPADVVLAPNGQFPKAWQTRSKAAWCYTAARFLPADRLPGRDRQ